MQPHKSILFFLKILFSIQTSPPPHFFIGHPSWHLRLPLSSPPLLLHICQTPSNVFITFSSCITTRPSSPLRSSSLTSFSNLLPRTRKGAARMVLPPAASQSTINKWQQFYNHWPAILRNIVFHPEISFKLIILCLNHSFDC